MKIKPHEILQCLGFNISEDGIDASSNEISSYSSLFSIMGATINVANVPDDILFAFYRPYSHSKGIEYNSSEIKLARTHISKFINQKLSFEPLKFS